MAGRPKAKIKKSKFNSKQLLLVVIIFAIIGGVVFLLKSRAETPTDDYAHIDHPPVAIAAQKDQSVWVAGSDGGVFALGKADFYSSIPGKSGAQRVVGIAAHGDDGYWLAGADGGVYAFGGAPFINSLPGWVAQYPSQPVCGEVVGISTSTAGNGYAMVSNCGMVYAWGIPYKGSLYRYDLDGAAARDLGKRNIVGITVKPDGGGYWLVGSDGAVYAFGNAGYAGGANTFAHNGTIVGMASTPDGTGYWLVGSDGGIYAFGNAHFYGSMGDRTLVGSIVGMSRSSGGNGYYLIASDGGVFAFGDATFPGRVYAEVPTSTPTPTVAATPRSGSTTTTGSGSSGGTHSTATATAKPASKPDCASDPGYCAADPCAPSGCATPTIVSSVPKTVGESCPSGMLPIDNGRSCAVRECSSGQKLVGSSCYVSCPAGYKPIDNGRSCEAVYKPNSKILAGECNLDFSLCHSSPTKAPSGLPAALSPSKIIEIIKGLPSSTKTGFSPTTTAKSAADTVKGPK